MVSDEVITNKIFYEKMRTKYFKKIRNMVNRISRNIEKLDSDTLIAYLYDNIKYIISLIEECLFYSKEALFAYEQNIMPLYSKETPYGILEEEKIFYFLLEEIYASLVFFDKYLTTEFNLINYKATLQKLKTRRNIKEGFITKLFKKIDRSAYYDIIHHHLYFVNTRIKALNEINKIILDLHKYIKE